MKASKPPKRAEGKVTTPRKDEEITNAPVEDSVPAVVPALSAEEKADSKVKPAPEVTTTRRDRMQSEYDAAKAETKKWKKKLQEWGAEFEKKHNHPPSMEEKKADPYMQEIFQNYFAVCSLSPQYVYFDLNLYCFLLIGFQ